VRGLRGGIAVRGGSLDKRSRVDWVAFGEEGRLGDHERSYQRYAATNPPHGGRGVSLGGGWPYTPAQASDTGIHTVSSLPIAHHDGRGRGFPRRVLRRIT